MPGAQVPWLVVALPHFIDPQTPLLQTPGALVLWSSEMQFELSYRLSVPPQLVVATPHSHAEQLRVSSTPV